jgi:3-phosphoshikimate 1-carboxyvinyltransferase
VITLVGQPELRARDVVVPGDPSSAAFAVVAALLVPGSSVTVTGVGLNPLRAGLFATLQQMGADLTLGNERVAGGEPVGDLTARHGPLHGIDVPPDRAPAMIDEYPILAVLAAFAQGRTRMRGLAELRVKESDRLTATAAMLQAAGAQVAIEGDDLIVTGASSVPGGCTVATHMDHRLAMSALVMGQATADPVAVDDAAFIETSFPGFAALLRSVGADIQ